MIYINEWLPNPAGSDTSGEFVELFNNGDAAASLSGWVLSSGGGSASRSGHSGSEKPSGSMRSETLQGRTTGGKTQGGKTLKLSDNISANGFLVLGRSETKLVLKNSDEKLFLYDAGGKLVDESGFLGSAPEGKSFSRLRASFAEVATKAEQDYGGQARVGQMSDVKGQMFSWGDPTPGALNKISLDTSIIHNVYPFNVPLNKNLGAVEFWSMMLGAAIALSALIIFALKQNENLSKLFFGRDEEAWL